MALQGFCLASHSEPVTHSVHPTCELLRPDCPDLRVQNEPGSSARTKGPRSRESDSSSDAESTTRRYRSNNLNTGDRRRTLARPATLGSPSDGSTVNLNERALGIA